MDFLNNQYATRVLAQKKRITKPAGDWNPYIGGKTIFL
jgi:hypothetical protein